MGTDDRPAANVERRAYPFIYAERFSTQIYNERIVYPGAWNKLVVVAREDDHETMLNHALIQSRRRYRA